MPVNRWRHLHVKDSDEIGIAMAADFERRAMAAGWSRGQIDHAIKLVATNDVRWGSMPLDEAAAEYEAGMAHMVTDSNVAFTYDWLSGFDGTDSTPQPSESERMSRLQELDEMSKNAAPDSPYYHGPDSKQLQAEHEALLAGDVEITDAQFEQAASQASETLDEGQVMEALGFEDNNAFDNNAADSAADYGDINDQ